MSGKPELPDMSSIVPDINRIMDQHNAKQDIERAAAQERARIAAAVLPELEDIRGCMADVRQRVSSYDTYCHESLLDSWCKRLAALAEKVRGA